MKITILLATIVSCCSCLGCHAFQLQADQACWRIQRSQDVISMHAAAPGISRRSVFTISTAALTAVLGVPSRVPAVVVVGGAVQSARVSSWPGIENLEPMYELKLSIDALAAGVADPNNWSFVQKRLDKFFQGGIFSEKNFYFGVGLQYMNAMKYDEAELPNYVLMDKQTRYNALEETMKSLERLKSTLASPNVSVLKDVLEDNAKASQAALASWFALLPPSDVTAVQELFEHAKKADLNRDGRLSDSELASLSFTEQELWKRRVAKFG